MTQSQYLTQSIPNDPPFNSKLSSHAQIQIKDSDPPINRDYTATHPTNRGHFRVPRPIMFQIE